MNDNTKKIISLIADNLRGAFWVLLFVALNTFFQGIIAVYSAVSANNPEITMYDYTVGSITASMPMFIILLLYVIIKENKTKDEILKPVKVQNISLLALFAIVIYVAIQLILNLLMLVNEGFMNGYNVGDIFETELSKPVLFMSICVCAPFVEEITIRYGIQKNLSRTNEWYALVMQAFVFAILHQNPIQIGYAFIIGLIFGFVYKESNYNLNTTIIMHIVFNSLSFAISFGNENPYSILTDIALGFALLWSLAEYGCFDREKIKKICTS